MINVHQYKTSKVFFIYTLQNTVQIKKDPDNQGSVFTLDRVKYIFTLLYR